MRDYRAATQQQAAAAAGEQQQEEQEQQADGGVPDAQQQQQEQRRRRRAAAEMSPGEAERLAEAAKPFVAVRACLWQLRPGVLALCRRGVCCAPASRSTHTTSPPCLPLPPEANCRR